MAAHAGHISTSSPQPNAAATSSVEQGFVVVLDAGDARDLTRSGLVEEPAP